MCVCVCVCSHKVPRFPISSHVCICLRQESDLSASLKEWLLEFFDSKTDLSMHIMKIRNWENKCSHPPSTYPGSATEGIVFLSVLATHCTCSMYGYKFNLKLFRLLPTDPICSHSEGFWPSWGLWSTPPLQPYLISSPWQQGLPLTAAHWQALWIFNQREWKEEKVWE